MKPTDKEALTNSKKSLALRKYLAALFLSSLTD